MPTFSEIHACERATLTFEYLLVTAGITIPFAAFYPNFVDMLNEYFYRVSAVIALPCP
ncbi:MAG: hypothetical protein AAGD00_09215 [Planctomycetota bacterium]